MNRSSFFARAAKKTADLTGKPGAFILAFTVILVWGISGPLFDYSDTWQLVINTSTTIITFLMVFLIQNAQNRDTRALQIKLDELIRVTEGAHTALLDLEELSDQELCDFVERYTTIAKESRKLMKTGDEDTHVPHIEMPRETPAPKPAKKSPRKKSPK